MVAASSDRMRLDRRPEATAFQVDDLLAKVESGQLRLPDFQRKLKWQTRDMLDLFDSLYRGFPIGTLLLWKRPAPARNVTFGAFAVEAPRREDALFIVDGQQRTTTLASNLLVRRNPGERALLFDPDDERFHFGPVPQDVPTLPGVEPAKARTVAVQDLYDSARAIAWMATRYKALRPEFVQRAIDCGKRLREYHVPVYVVETDDEGVLREIFDRVNRTGRRLDDTDVFTALFATTSALGERLDLGHVARRLARLGFGTLEDDTVLASLRAVADLPLDKDFAKDLDREDAANALLVTEAALERTVRFLRASGFPHASLVPYTLVFVVLARLFHLHPEPRHRNLTLLRRWVWRGALAGQLAGSTVGLRQHVGAVTVDEDASVQALLALEAAAPRNTELDLGVFRLNTARSALAACALAALEPRDLTTGEALDVPAIFERSPRKPLPEVVVGDGARSDLARSANRLLHPPGRDMTARLVAAEPTVLASHGIPGATRSRVASQSPKRRRPAPERLGGRFRASSTSPRSSTQRSTPIWRRRRCPDVGSLWTRPRKFLGEARPGAPASVRMVGATLPVRPRRPSARSARAPFPARSRGGSPRGSGPCGSPSPARPPPASRRRRRGRRRRRPRAPCRRSSRRTSRRRGCAR